MKSRITQYAEWPIEKSFNYNYGCIDVYFNVAAGRSKAKCNYFIYC